MLPNSNPNENAYHIYSNPIIDTETDLEVVRYRQAQISNRRLYGNVNKGEQLCEHQNQNTHKFWAHHFRGGELCINAPENVNKTSALADEPRAKAVKSAKTTRQQLTI